jgi:hypothetical protein
MEFSPGFTERVEGIDHRDDWGRRAELTSRWLEELRREVEAPDLWATIGQEKVLPTAALSARLDNRPFAPDEQLVIDAKLDQIKAFLLNGQQFATAQAESVEQEFAYLKESSKRMGRKDWLNILLGGLFGLAVTLALDPEKARSVMRLAGTMLQILGGQVYLE